jgi:hypothetical protein
MNKRRRKKQEEGYEFYSPDLIVEELAVDFLDTFASQPQEKDS